MGKRFLIGQLARFGDCLLATPIARQIKHDYPDSHITWAVDRKYRSILDRNPCIDKIWELSIPDGDYYGAGWNNFKAQALQKKQNGEFDEIIFSQINPDNLLSYNGTIRGTTLAAYGKPITVSVEPMVILSQNEIENVRHFAETNNLSAFASVVLFECSPKSGQSKVNPDFALSVTNEIVRQNRDICFILTGSEIPKTTNPQIVDGSELSFKENAELTKYCTLLIGCSSGISWLATADWAKKLPTIQLLDKNYNLFAGMHHDFAINSLDNSHILEMVDFDEQRTVLCLESVLKNGLAKSKNRFHQTYKPTLFNLEEMVKFHLLRGDDFPAISRLIHTFVETNAAAGNPISRNYMILRAKVYAKLKIRSVRHRFSLLRKSVWAKIAWK